ncbi:MULTISPECIES: glutamine-hydrolyzing carbamoyl-phosphate synthase small subunit [Eubacterium]|uniref:Carbamoyl phosphate synthase small chain n=1 Tax=Eubacterium ruminantium TaxID=42322 RepID=A0A1T4MPK1_9FIRM|nr:MULTISPECIES: glutamine-hydrolyzing carbamoyl-phosphate synthase small subunit [Eubacterium]MCR5367954.1 glutamine-hydrolyzing carbamoyl-phosphate synthase small subunit [Eubacterium sp.]SCW49418.1 carbamoyl-phosphate synthase small subunit [Eubacterium ruminantium]SDM60239.1 carbamoyl-phosphate synthase small subunit [Eubacterium ruminantium]SJZ68704.1 carbamoyl-phosphate synthase small subunit [Eubacterium ruminantium]
MNEYNKKLILEDGSEYYGYSFGAEKDTVCEMVFNTSMAGYQEILSDPSYTYQGVVMSYPLIGNYGITDEDFESRMVALSALIVRDVNDNPSNFRFTRTLPELLYEYDVPGIYGIDTRKLVRNIRDKGSLRGLLTDPSVTAEEGVLRIKNTPVPKDAVARCSCKKKWYLRTTNPKYKVVVIDCGIKTNILKMISKHSCNITVVPYDTSAEEILQLSPDGLFISNGPGDPEDVKPVIETIKGLKGKLPIFGICLGHQLIALSYGAKTYKLKFGHRGGNHPVKDLTTGKIEITSQNHSYAVDKDSVEGTGLKISHINLLDNTVEGLVSEEDKCFSVQYHPESAPGPQDSTYLFDRFIKNMEDYKNA